MTTAVPRQRWVWTVEELIDTVDGDTWDLKLMRSHDYALDTGFHDELTVTVVSHKSARFRLFDVDAIESNRTGGAAATAFGDAWIRAALDAGVLEAESFKSDKYLPDGQFGRWLIDLYRTDNGVHLRDALIEAGHRKVR